MLCLLRCCTQAACLAQYYAANNEADSAQLSMPQICNDPQLSQKCSRSFAQKAVRDSLEAAHVANLVINHHWQVPGKAEADMAAEWSGLGEAVEVAQGKGKADWLIQVDRDLLFFLQNNSQNAYRAQVTQQGSSNRHGRRC